MNTPYTTGLMWFRRDLRVDDNTALRLALRSCRLVHAVFVFDTDILDALPRDDRRVEFIHASVGALDADLRAACCQPAGGLIVRHGHARHEVVALARTLGVQAVFAARDYEPQAIERDNAVLGALAEAGIALRLCKDQVVFEGREIVSAAGTPYTVFTPYKRAWLARAAEAGPALIAADDASLLAQALAPLPKGQHAAPPPLQDIGFTPGAWDHAHLPAGSRGARSLFDDFFGRMDDYQRSRDYPAVKGPSYLSVHLRFGTVSIRQLVATALQRSLHDNASGASTWLSELVWREFYFQILSNFPHVAASSFKPAYDAIAWERGAHAQALFRAWCEGRTGYPLVDAAMAQINQSGYMHNRLRMVSASFLVKHLGIDWRWGEAYFAQKLNDFDLAANNGGWQWVASSGCDAQPWFRIFHPVTQSQRFDAQGRFIRRYLPQLAKLPDEAIHAPWTAAPLELEAAGVHLGKNYPQPIVQHDEARRATLARYEAVRTLGGNTPPRAAAVPKRKLTAPTRRR